MKLAGTHVFRSPLLGNARPKLQLSERPDLLLSDAVRAEVNAWLLATFGTVEYAYWLGDEVLLVSPRTWERLLTTVSVIDEGAPRGHQ